MIIILFLFAQVELKGNLSGFLDYGGRDVLIKAEDTVRVTPYGENNDYDSTGWLIIRAKNIYVKGVIDGMGCGYGGGGGGGGATFIYPDGDNSPGAGGGDGGSPEGDPGEDASYKGEAVYGGSGGNGGGNGGEGGMEGEFEIGGIGGKGAGEYGGAGGINGRGGPGGYMGYEINGDTTTDFRVVMGSGGGGGGGGNATYENGFPGGCGGVGGGTGCHFQNGGFVLSGGGGGGGGGAGGASITLDAEDSLVVSGTIIADGMGYANMGGGYGAGGGIALKGSFVNITGSLIRTRGGISDGKGTRINGGTIKIFYRTLRGDVPEDNAGRIFKKRLPLGIEEKIENSPIILTISSTIFKESTVISYQVSKKSIITLKVYNINGQIVKTLARAQNLEPGVYTVEWDGRDERGDILPNGIYFLQLKRGGDNQIRKFLIIR